MRRSDHWPRTDARAWSPLQAYQAWSTVSGLTSKILGAEMIETSNRFLNEGKSTSFLNEEDVDTEDDEPEAEEDEEVNENDLIIGFWLLVGLMCCLIGFSKQDWNKLKPQVFFVFFWNGLVSIGFLNEDGFKDGDLDSSLMIEDEVFGFKISALVKLLFLMESVGEEGLKSFKSWWGMMIDDDEFKVKIKVKNKFNPKHFIPLVTFIIIFSIFFTPPPPQKKTPKKTKI